MVNKPDTLLLSSADALNTMLKVCECELYAKEHGITSNPNKTKLKHFTSININFRTTWRDLGIRYII